MASQAPPPSSPAGVPSSGGAKYIVIAVVLLGLIAGGVVWKLSQKPEPSSPIVVVDAGPPQPIVSGGRNLDDDIPLPAPVEDAGPEKKVVITQVSNACDAKRCTGTAGPELENALGFRAKQAHRCYDNALAQDPTLRGKVTVAVRVGSNGQVCSANVASNDMGSSVVASCVAGYFRGASFPAPKGGGCVDVNIPINFVPRQ